MLVALGATALATGVRASLGNRLASLALVVAFAAPVVCLVIVGWTLAAASTPNT